MDLISISLVTHNESVFVNYRKSPRFQADGERSADEHTGVHVRLYDKY